MAKTKGLLDQYPQTVTVRVTEAVAEDGAIVQVPSSYSMRDRVGMEILGYNIMPYGAFAWRGMLAADKDFLGAGLSHLFRGGSIPAIEEPTGLIDAYLRYRENTIVSAVGEITIVEEPAVRIVFPQPLIAHPASVWAWVKGFQVSAVVDLIFRINYRLIDLSDSQWQELFESILIRDTI